MPIPTITVTGTVLPPSNVSTGGSVLFELSASVVDPGAGVVVPRTVSTPILTGGAISVALWPNELGLIQTRYAVYVVMPPGAPGLDEERTLIGYAVFPASPATQDLGDMISQSTSGVLVGPIIYPTLADAVQAALDAADAAAQSAADAQTWTPAYAAEAVADAEAARDRAQAWAESATAPDPELPASKSAKTWAAEAEASADSVETVLNSTSNAIFGVGDTTDGLSYDVVIAERAMVSEDDTAPLPSVTVEIEPGTIVSLLKAETGVGILQAADDAEAAATAAAAARDSTFVNGGRVATSIAAGRALAADGQQFAVVEGDWVQLYTRTSSTTETIITGARYPTSAFVFDQSRITARNASLAGAAAPGGFSTLYNLVPNIVAGSPGSTGGRWIAFDAGVQVQAGDVVDAVGAEISVASTATQVRVQVWETATADAGVNLAPPQSGDVALADFNMPLASAIATDGGANGIAANTAAREMAFTLPLPFQVRAGRTYKVAVSALDASAVEVASNIASRSPITAVAQQRYVGGRRATPGAAYTNMNTTQRNAISLLRRVLFSASRQATLNASEEAEAEAKSQADLAARMARNHDRLAAHAALFSRTLPDALTFSGDSLVENSTTHVLSGQKASDVVGRYVTGTVNNIAAGGTRSDEILAAFNALSVGQKNDVGITNGGTNDVLQGVANVVTAVATNMQAVAAISANRIIQGPWAGGNTRFFAQCRAISATLRASLGAKFFDPLPFIQYFGAGSATEINAMRQGGYPPSLATDTLGHPNTAGAAIFGREWALICRAQAGIGAPYIHDDYVVAADTSGAAVHTLRVLGSAQRFRIVAGNESLAFEINATTGAITRSSVAGVMPPWAELIVQAESVFGPSNEARIVVGRRMAGTRPMSAVRTLANSAGVVGSAARLITPGLTGGAATKRMTVVLAGRMNNLSNGGILTSLRSTDFADNGLVTKEGRNLRFFARAADGTLGGNIFSPIPEQDGFGWHVWFFSMDTNSGNQFMKAAVDEITSSNVVPTLDATVDLSLPLQVFASQATILRDFDVRMLWVAQDYIDIGDSAKRALFYTPGTREPLDLGAGGIVDGVTPILYLRGTAAEYQAGSNFGTGGALHASPYVNRARVGFEDVT